MLLFGRVMDDAALQGVSSLLNAGVAIRSKDGQTLASDEALPLIWAKMRLRPSPNSIP
ncbi:hypothetical protein [Cohnella faecalis]|uniref:hypothetical protein n=1 Tax=Cohnella faecalis TaxID=2315694 RepID=UPI001313DA28|nr:hypothetical protein [Cohnella faecalis]